MLNVRSKLSEVLTVVVLAGSLLGAMGGVAAANPKLVLDQELQPMGVTSSDDLDPQTGAQWR